MPIKAESLSRAPSFADLPTAAREALAENLREVRFGRDERLIPMGRSPERLLILTHGLVKLVGVSPDGHERILFLYRPGDIVGPTVLLDSFEQDYEATAMTSAEALALSRRDLLRLGRVHPSILMALAREVSRLLAAMTDRVLHATSAEVPVRLSRLLLEFADGRTDGPGANGGNGADPLVPLSYPLTHELMAQIVGASRPHTSTVLRDLEMAGAVRRRSRRGLLVQSHRLREIVDLGSLIGNGALAGNGKREGDAPAFARAV